MALSLMLSVSTILHTGRLNQMRRIHALELLSSATLLAPLILAGPPFI